MIFFLILKRSHRPFGHLCRSWALIWYHIRPSNFRVDKFS